MSTSSRNSFVLQLLVARCIISQPTGPPMPPEFPNTPYPGCPRALLAASRQNGTNVLRDAATLYKVDTESIASKVKQELGTKASPKKEVKSAAKLKRAA